MANYELLLAVSEKVTEADQDKLIKEITNSIEKAKGEVKQVDSWGKRTLAYPINKDKSAFYYLLTFNGGPELPKTLTSMLRIEDKILRFIIERQEVVKRTRKPKKKKTTTVEIIR